MFSSERIEPGQLEIGRALCPVAMASGLRISAPNLRRL